MQNSINSYLIISQKKNTRRGDRKKLLETLEMGSVSAEGTIGTVSLNFEKVSRWRRQLEQAEALSDDQSHRDRPSNQFN